MSSRWKRNIVGKAVGKPVGKYRLPVRIAAMVGVLGLFAAATPAAASGGFAGPIFGLSTAPNGTLVVADAGAGIVSLGDRGQTYPLLGISDMSAIGRHAFWAVASGEDGETDSGQGLYRIMKHGNRQIANTFRFENKRNPDGADVDTNPFDVETLNRRSALVVDSGANDLLRVVYGGRGANKKGRIEALAIFPPEIVSTSNIQQLAGCPNVMIPDFADICDVPEMPAEAVPTSVAVGPDGSYYVGELKGFPAPTGESNIWRVDPTAHWAQCGSSPDCVKVFDGGFTSIIDLTFGPDGKLYVAEMDVDSWAAVEIFESGQGGQVSACDVHTLDCTVVASGIPMLTAIAFDGDGQLWATTNALIPDMAEVIAIP